MLTIKVLKRKDSANEAPVWGFVNRDNSYHVEDCELPVALDNYNYNELSFRYGSGLYEVVELELRVKEKVPTRDRMAEAFGSDWDDMFEHE